MKYLILAILIIFSVSCTTDGTTFMKLTLQDLQDISSDPIARNELEKSFQKHFGTPNETYTITDWTYGNVADNAVPMTMVIKTSANAITSYKHTKENVEEFIRWMFSSFDGITITGELATGTGDVIAGMAVEGTCSG